MKRFTFTVTVKRDDGREINYDAMQIIANVNGTVTFISSGIPNTVSADAITDVKIGRAEWCGMCDQSISHMSWS